MVKIAFTNQDRQSAYKKAIFDVASGTYLVNDNEKIGPHSFRTLNFSHPLLNHPVLYPVNNICQYTCNSRKTFLQMARYIYATLIQEESSRDYLFKITSSEALFHSMNNHKIPFSIDYHKAASKLISVNHLNAIITEFSDCRFQFYDHLLIDEEVSFTNLPPVVNGDSLFEENPILNQLLNQSDDFKKYELRYINSLIGCGVYSRKLIREGEAVCVYYGKKSSDPINKRYYFNPEIDVLNLGVDAREYGNIARFVNHAPASDNSDCSLIKANLVAKRDVLNGIENIVYYALRDIIKGEQLLIDYGVEYFEHMEPFRFTPDGTLVSVENGALFDSKEQREAIAKIITKHESRQNIDRLFKRVAIILSVVICLLLLINYFLPELT
ncbi:MULTISPECIES: SET domain-containing protein-lysine N-methyltransferase [unclassified Legionella]|uniref:SET domain-containing protein-lysine N-methyltransferase n=1 Tax=unclassified Legionella TaxID=2622702 RepID=UPI001054A921|nr:MULTISPECIES: SET domain-containing protein-lysine N-methyltransferase [unclassified Legionella]MDI9819279.1 SET domain-containing protein-lysine N-methyltransferase [Legionella sp. PL877]